MVCLSGNTVFIYFEDSVISLITMCHTTYCYILRHEQTHIHIHTRLCFMGTFHRHDDIYTVLYKLFILYPNPTPKPTVPITENFLHFYISKKKKNTSSTGPNNVPTGTNIFGY